MLAKDVRTGITQSYLHLENNSGRWKESGTSLIGTKLIKKRVIGREIKKLLQSLGQQKLGTLGLEK